MDALPKQPNERSALVREKVGVKGEAKTDGAPAAAAAPNEAAAADNPAALVVAAVFVGIGAGIAAATTTWAEFGIA